jgi:hypothetical protein
MARDGVGVTEERRRRRFSIFLFFLLQGGDVFDEFGDLVFEGVEPFVMIHFGFGYKTRKGSFRTVRIFDQFLQLFNLVSDAINRIFNFSIVHGTIPFFGWVSLFGGWKDAVNAGLPRQ